MRSETRWRFVPGLPRFVGSGPVAAPPFWPGHSRCPDRRVPSRWHWRGPTRRAGAGATALSRQPPASPGVVANRSSRSHSPVLGQHFPRNAAVEHEDDAGQARPIWRSRGRPLRVSAAPLEVPVRYVPSGRPTRVACPWILLSRLMPQGRSMVLTGVLSPDELAEQVCQLDNGPSYPLLSHQCRPRLHWIRYCARQRYDVPETAG